MSVVSLCSVLGATTIPRLDPRVADHVLFNPSHRKIVERQPGWTEPEGLGGAFENQNGREEKRRERERREKNDTGRREITNRERDRARGRDDSGENIASLLGSWSRVEWSGVEPSRVVAPCPQRDRAKAFSS